MTGYKTIRQIESKVKISTRTPQKNQTTNTIEISCQSFHHAQTLALSLAGVKSSPRLDKFQKLKTHPWYGQVIIQDLSGDNRQFITLFIEKSIHLLDEQFRMSVHRLFIDDPERPINHVTIQEVLHVVSN